MDRAFWLVVCQGAAQRQPLPRRDRPPIPGPPTGLDPADLTEVDLDDDHRGSLRNCGLGLLGHGVSPSRTGCNGSETRSPFRKAERNASHLTPCASCGLRKRDRRVPPSEVKDAGRAAHGAHSDCSHGCWRDAERIAPDAPTFRMARERPSAPGEPTVKPPAPQPATGLTPPLAHRLRPTRTNPLDPAAPDP